MYMYVHGKQTINNNDCSSINNINNISIYNLSSLLCVIVPFFLFPNLPFILDQFILVTITINVSLSFSPHPQLYMIFVIIYNWQYNNDYHHARSLSSATSFLWSLRGIYLIVAILNSPSLRSYSFLDASTIHTFCIISFHRPYLY